MKSLYRRQFALMAAMILVSFLLLGSSVVVLTYQYTIREKMTTIESNAANVADYTASSMGWLGGGLRSDSYKLYVSSVAQVANSYVLITDSAGQMILYAGSPNDDIASGAIPAEVLEQISVEGAYSSITDLGGMFPDRRLVAARPIVTKNFDIFSGTVVPQVSGIAFVVAETGSSTELWRAFSNIFLFAAVVVMCLTFIATSLTTLHLTKPLKEMAQAARKFGHGEFETRVDVGQRKDEIGELATAFNEMADALAKSEARRSEFVANISHELKTPMTTIAGFSDGILDGTIPPEREQEALRTISSETRRLSRLVRQMLDLSRLQSEETLTAQEQFDVSEVLVRVLVSLEPKINARRLDVETNIPDDPVRVWGDPDGITQVCYNLLDNAIKFAGEGSTITLNVVPKGDRAHISVINRGETIPAEELPMLFDRFHKSDKSRSVDREGVGLGLYIVKTILNNHKENITVTSECGVTEFTFTLLLA